MRRLSLYFIFLILIGCDSGGDDSVSPTYQGPADEEIVTTNVNGCLDTHNADVEVDYLIGDKLSKNLRWKCLSNGNSRTLFYPYDYARQCYVIAGARSNSGRCDYNSAPDVPLFLVTIETFGGYFNPIGGGNYAITPVTVVQNEGNVIAFGVDWEIKRGSEVLETGTIGSITPTANGYNDNWEVARAATPFVFDSATPSDFTFTLYDHYGVVLDSQTLSF